MRLRRVVVVGVLTSITGTMLAAAPAGAQVACTITAPDIDGNWGTSGDDVICGTADGDQIHAGAGDDVVYGGGGQDTIAGGDGNDTLYGEAGQDRLYGDADLSGSIGASPGNDTMYGGDDFDTFFGDPGNDRMESGAGPSNFFDQSESANGSDSFIGGPDVDSVSIFARTNPMSLSLDGVANDGEIGEGDNLVDIEAAEGGMGNDTITGSAARDILLGNAGNDVINAGEGNDYLFGADGADEVYGGGGDDDVRGALGDDKVYGGEGNDLLNEQNFEDTDNGSDDLNGGAGTDTVDYSVRLEPVMVTFDDVANDGEPGENDNVRSDVELAIDEPELETVQAEITAAGQQATTDRPSGPFPGASAGDPVETTVTAGAAVCGFWDPDDPSLCHFWQSIQLNEFVTTESAPAGYRFVGQSISVSMPETTAANAHTLDIAVDSTLVPDPADPTSVEAFRSGTLIPECAGSADPDPCVQSRAFVGDDLVITISTTVGGPYDVGVVASAPPPPPPPPPSEPTAGESEGTTDYASAGEPVTTDIDGDGATAGDVVETTVIPPVAGTVSILESSTPTLTEPNYDMLDVQVNITAPPAESPDAPLVLVFTLDSSLIPEGVTAGEIAVFRSGELLPDCLGATDLSSSGLERCVSKRETLSDGDVRLTVLTMAASPWNFGVFVPVVHHERSVTLKLSKHLLATGRISVPDGFQECAAFTEVILQRRVKDGWKTVERTATGSRGGYRNPLRDVPGIYRARLPRVRLIEDVCGRARSRRVAHRH